MEGEGDDDVNVKMRFEEVAKGETDDGVEADEVEDEMEDDEDDSINNSDDDRDDESTVVDGKAKIKWIKNKEEKRIKD